MQLKLIMATIGIIFSSSLAAANGPVAIIENIENAKSPLAFMDYVTKGQVIELGINGRLVMGYLASCRRETITGGTVSVGQKQSTVTKGQVLLEDVECDGGNAQLTGQQAASSAALAFRGTKKKLGLRKADITVYGTSPVVLLKQANAEIHIERIDQQSSPITIQVTGKHIDLADRHIELVNGSLYTIRTKTGKGLTFKVDKYALQGKIAIVSRLIEL